MRKFIDIDTGETITETQLKEEFKTLQAEQPEVYNYSFTRYILDCTGKNGTLKEV